LHASRPALEPPLRVQSCIVGLLLAAACGGGEPEAGGEPFTPKATVEVATLQPEELRNVAEIPGQLESEQTVWVRSEIEGILASIDFEEGQQVEAGQVLFRIRDDEQRARLREAEAELALAQDVFDRTRELASKHVSSAAQLDRARRAQRGPRAPRAGSRAAGTHANSGSLRGGGGSARGLHR
jgi:multidrug efflux pump subunit AcrA (membrane-fusion protein)